MTGFGMAALLVAPVSRSPRFLESVNDRRPGVLANEGENVFVSKHIQDINQGVHVY